MLNTEELFLKLLRFISITPEEDGAFAFVKEYLSDFDVIELNIEQTKNLFLYKRFGDGAHLCFAGHIDVVPPGHGWNSNPFEPVIHEGIIYARGAQDMKSGVTAAVQALRQTQHFDGTLSLLLTSDEEGDAKHGTIEMIKELERRNLLPGCAIVAEPTSEKNFGDAIKIGRRGSINGVIEIAGKQGHAAYPEKTINPVHQIAPRLNKLAGYQFDAGDAQFSPSQLVITDIRGGMEVTNVTPGQLKIMFNVRNSTNTTLETIRVYVQEVLEGLEFTLRLSESAQPFVTSKEAHIVSLVSNALLHITQKSPKLSTAGGTSDARFFGSFGVETIECGVVNDTIHAPNECCPLHEVEALVSTFCYVIENFSKENR